MILKLKENANDLFEFEVIVKFVGSLEPGAPISVQLLIVLEDTDALQPTICILLCTDSLKYPSATVEEFHPRDVSSRNVSPQHWQKEPSG